MKILNLFLLTQLSGYIAFAQIKINPIKSLSGLPIKAERTITISTNESSYLDVDISPDGSTILFTCLGELFSLPAKGGLATQLTRGLAINRCPVWSPDGKLIAYESDATGFIQLHATDLLGRLHKVLGGPYTYSFDPTWFPDSKQIAVNDKIYHLTGITSSSQQNILGFSQDGKFVYFLKYYTSDLSAIVKYNRFDRAKTVSYIKRQDCNNARISADGNWFTYIKYKSVDLPNDVYGPADSLMAIDMRTGKEKLLTHLNIKFTTNYLSIQHYSFSKDSKYLFIGYGGKIHRIEIETGKNDIIPFTADIKVDMGAFVYNKHKVSMDSLQVKYIRSASKSPDGKHLVFSALNKIYIQDLPNGKPRILADQPFNQFQPTYSPDGKTICYVSWSDEQGGHLWIVPSRGGEPKQITTVSGLYQHPSWSPDGKQLAVIKGENKLGDRDSPGDGQLQVVSIKEGIVKVIENKVPIFNEPMFSKAGKEIAFTPDQQGSSEKLWPQLVSKEIESKRETILAYANTAFGHSRIRQTVFSPDERYCVFAKNEDIYLVPIANIEGAQTFFDYMHPVQSIRFARGAIDPKWEDGGKVLSWINGNKYCSINPDKIIDAAEHLEPNKILEGLPQTKIIDVNIPADKVISIHLKASRKYANGLFAFKNARIITMHGNDVIERGTVLIKDGRIVSVGRSKNVNIPGGAAVIDITGRTIMPGLINMHSHMYAAVPPDVFLQQSPERLLEFSYGITTMRDPSGSFDTFGYSELVETDQAIGPRLNTVGFAVREHYNLTSLEKTKIVVSNRKKYGATYIKQYQQPTRLQRQLLLQACKEEGLNMTNEGEKEPLYFLGMYKDGSTGIEHNTEWGDVYDDVIKLVAKSGTYLCPTLQACYGRKQGTYYFHKLYGQDFSDRRSRFYPDSNNWSRDRLLEDIDAISLDSSFLDQSKIDARIKNAGGKIVMGSHGEDQGIGAHWEIWALQMGGLTNYQALETATITAAEALGMRKDLGSIEVGKIADLIILDKNPLDDIHNTNTIRYVMKAGVLYESETLDEIWPEKKKCPEWRMKNEVKN